MSPKSNFALSDADMEPMWQIVQNVSKECRVSTESIVRHGKLPKEHMEARRKAIRRIHATGRYRRSQIARYFGLSTYTITSSLEDSIKNRPAPFLPEEDDRIQEMHCAGFTIEHMHRQLPSRSVAAIRRRLIKLHHSHLGSRSFPKPSYQSEDASSSMLELAKIENARMRKNL